MATKSVKKTYDSSNIKNLQGMEAIRAKPGMYIGATDASGVFTILREVADNVVDEALAGRASTCEVHVDKNSQFWVLDDGEGIPVKPIKIKDQFADKVHNVPAITAILSLTHTSGKFDNTENSAYKASRGSHGVGIKATNALSKEFEVWTMRDGSWWNIQYSRGVLTSALAKSKAPMHPVTRKRVEGGTVVRFIPDEKIFSSVGMSLADLSDWGRIAAYFTPSLTVNLTRHDGKALKLYFENGPQAYTELKIYKLKAARVADTEFVCNNPLIDCVIAFTDHDGSAMDAFTNGLRNSEGGFHMDAFYSAFKSVLLEYAGSVSGVRRQRKPAAKRAKGAKAPTPPSLFTLNDIKEGLVGLVNAKLSAPQFDSQTKDKLVDERAKEPIRLMMKEALSAFFAENKGLAKSLCEKAIRINGLRSKFIASKKVTSALKNITKKGLPAKAAVAPNCTVEERELFLVEGDSAAGIARNARFSYFQETLGLKGKILNVGRAKDSRALESDEILNILAQIGLDPKSDDPVSNLRVGKIICLADPDPDGPLGGETKVPIRFEGVWYTKSMEELASPEWRNREYSVLAWNGRAFCISEAHSCRIMEYVDSIVHIELSNGQKLRASRNHQFPLFQTKQGYRTLSHTNTGLRMIKAHELKAGDKICAVEDGGLKHSPASVQSFHGMHSVSVTKVKVKASELTPMYCLTVPAYENFVLASGILSKNCHINALLLTMFWKFLPQLFERGMIYCAQVPEYYAVTKLGQAHFGASSNELQALLDKMGVKAEVKHCKGYGEVNHELLRAMAFNPETRTIARIVPTENDEGEVKFKMLMSGGSEARKLLLGI